MNPDYLHIFLVKSCRIPDTKLWENVSKQNVIWKLHWNYAKSLSPGLHPSCFPMYIRLNDMTKVNICHWYQHQMDQKLSCSSYIENYFRLYSALRILPHFTVVLAGSRTPPLGVTIDLRAFGFRFMVPSSTVKGFIDFRY
jgi:hypothetical protein